jgi:hypothetical protein
LGEWTHIHEAGHATVVHALHWPLGAITARAGIHADGCTIYSVPLPDGEPCVDQPLAMWPASWQQWALGSAMVLAAGEEATHLLARPQTTTRLPDDVYSTAAAAVAARDEPSDQERASLATVTDDAEHPADADRLAHLAWLVHDGDPLTTSAWLAYVAESTRAVLLGSAGRLMRLAELLDVADVVSARAAAACLEVSR